MLFKTLTVLVLLLASLSICQIDSQLNEIEGNVLDVQWCGENDEVMFLLSDSLALYRSEDNGFSWRQLNSQLDKLGKQALDEDERVGNVSKLKLSPVDVSTILFVGTRGINWITDNCGKTIKAMNHGRKIREIIFHPTEKDWFLAAAFTSCDDFDETEQCQIYKELYITLDFGKTWKFLHDFVVQFDWGLKTPEHLEKGIPRERIFITFDQKVTGHQQFGKWSHTVHFAYSDDFFQTKKILVPKGNKFTLTTDYLFVAQAVSETEQTVNLMVSNINYDNFEQFRKAMLPMRMLREHSYTILDTSEGTVFLQIHHAKNYPYGNIYVSDSTGIRYALSLKNNLRDSNGFCDFDKIDGLEGVYMANVYDDKVVAEYEAQLTESPSQAIPNPYGRLLQQQQQRTTGLNRKGAPKAKKEVQNIKQQKIMLSQHVMTYITFNKGGSWKLVKAPEKDANGRVITCQGKAGGRSCSLHLHGLLSPNFPPFYSIDNAVGLVMGVGNVGTTLKTRKDQVNVYFSRDGGMYWEEAKKGSFIYDYGDHGALMLMAKDNLATNEMIYSWNEGLTWETYLFSESKVEVTNILNDPRTISQNFLLYGGKYDSNSTKSVVVALNFEGLHEPVCTGFDEPDSDSSDYEKWEPYDGRHGNECLMGKKVAYIRRKREAACFNGQEFERPIFEEFCDCAEEDYECDFGFTKRTFGGPCESFKPLNYSPPADCISGDYYYVSQGYRKVAGDVCVGGILHDPVKLPCPTEKSMSYSAIIILVLLIFIIILLLGMNFSSKHIGSVKGFIESIFSGERKGKKGRDEYRNVKYRGIDKFADTDDDLVIRDNEPIEEREEKIQIKTQEEENEKEEEEHPLQVKKKAISEKSVPTLQKP